MGGETAGTVAVVTGASTGIGRELALQLAAGGARVGLIARRADLLAELCGQIRQGDGTAEFYAANVSRPDDMAAAVDHFQRELGPIDLMIANAGIGRPTRLSPVNLPDVAETFEVNVLGVVYAFAAVLPGMLARRRGHLVGVSSLAGYKGLPGESAYCASKAAISVYLDGLRVHLRGTGVRVTTVCPGFVRTPMTEHDTFHPWRLEADEAARRILKAVRRGAKVYNFPWQAHWLVRLTGMMPDWLLGWGTKGYTGALKS